MSDTPPHPEARGRDRSDRERYRSPLRRRLATAVAVATVLASLGCFIEGSAGLYGVKNAETSSSVAKGFGIALGFYTDFGVGRAAAGVGGDIVTIDGYEDATGKGDVSHTAGPYYGRVDVNLIPLGGPFTLDATVGGFGGAGGAVVRYDSSVECIGQCSETLGKDGDRNTFKREGPSAGGFLGATVAMHGGQAGEVLLTVAGTVLHTNIDPRSPMTAYGAEVRITYGFQGFGKEGNEFLTIFRRGYDSEANRRSLERDMQRHNRDMGKHKERQRERDEQYRKEQEEKRKRRQQGLD